MDCDDTVLENSLLFNNYLIKITWMSCHYNDFLKDNTLIQISLVQGQNNDRVASEDQIHKKWSVKLAWLINTS